MNTKNSILLISDDGDLSKLLKSKLIFLRNNDEIILSDFKNALSNLRLCNADIVLVSENSSQKDTLELIKTLRENKGLCIILLVNSYDKEMILAGYDAGIDDFALSSADDFELVIRVVNNIKHNSLKLKGFLFYCLQFSYILCFSFLSFALKTIDMSVGYAIWCSLGILLISIIGIVFLHESVSLLKIASILLIILGAVGLRLAN